MTTATAWKPVADVPRGRRAVIYARVSTDGQTTENQILALTAEAERRGLVVVHVYQDQGISGARGRDRRPGLDQLLSDAVRGRYDVALVWHVDRLGRSLSGLLETLKVFDDHGRDLVIHQSPVDTTAPGGRMLFQIMGVFAEFERSMIVDRVHAGLHRARVHGTKTGRAIGRPPVLTAAQIQEARAEYQAAAAGTGPSTSVRKLASEYAVSPTVMGRVLRAPEARSCN